MLPLPKAISPFAVLPLLAAAMLWFAPTASATDTAPDWLRGAAQEKLPDYDKDTVAVILLD
jgi:hypothetical protein